MAKETDVEEIYKRVQEDRDVDEENAESLRNWFTNKGEHKFTPGRINLTRKLLEPSKVREEIDDVVFLKTKDENKQLDPLEGKIDDLAIKAPQKELKKLIVEKKRELRQERIIEKGKTTTFFKNQLIQATTVDDVQSILSEARPILEGKNLSFIEDVSSSKIEELKKEEVGG